ncbi:hypothetical protein HDV03_000925 [Kappamyces sp. JEL0829]|nr:hypothetical protein HDV03_000925 [Kappamyces sp. JEL0829]
MCGKVALKRIYATSSAVRIFTELNLLKCLRSYPFIASLITAIRHEDQIVAVLPYFEHDNFKNFYKNMTRNQIADYIFCMSAALASVHKWGYIHRDVKPSNFLYNTTLQTGVLIDFGLAQAMPSEVDLKAHSAAAAQVAGSALPPTKLGYLVTDNSIRASRAGTRGFRAPEVLFKVTCQTTGLLLQLTHMAAIDMWSVGVTLLCILSAQFPFFQSNDDTEALLEIAHIFGKDAMKKAAHRFGRTFDTNIPSVGRPQSLRSVCEKMNPGICERVGDDGLDLLDKLMDLDPTTRLTARMAIDHPFLAEARIRHPPLPASVLE